LYVSDLDGTLLDNDSLVSEETSAIISDLSRRGALITVATARTPATVAPLLHSTYTCCPAIVMTGAALWDRERSQLAKLHMFAPGMAADIAAQFRLVGLDPFIYTVSSPSHLEVYHGKDMTPGEDNFYQIRRNLELKKFHIGSVPDPREMDRTILFFCIGATERMSRLAYVLGKRTDCSMSFYPDITSPDSSLIEVFARGVSKAAAVKELADSLGADRIVVFGDNLNDLSMMSVADVSVAVANALPQVKEAADVVIGPNCDNSVARFIKKMETEGFYNS